MSLIEDSDGMLRISNMILHVVGSSTEFIPADARLVEHEEFFITRIRDTYADPVHSFNPNSAVKNRLERMASGSEPFQDGAQELSRLFSLSHVGSSRPGALFIFELDCEKPGVKFYSFIKYDFSQAIEQADGEGGSILRMIVHALIADKKAIQKSAMIKVIDGVAQLEISATDRTKRPPELADYFVAYLDAVRVLSDEDLNNRLMDVLKTTFTACKDNLSVSVPVALRSAKDILRNAPSINEDAIVGAVLSVAGDPTDDSIRSLIEVCTRRRIRASKLEGLAFRPDPVVLARTPIRKLRTTEGVEIRYPDHANGGSVRRVPGIDGSETITIETARVLEDLIVNQ